MREIRAGEPAGHTNHPWHQQSIVLSEPRVCPSPLPTAIDKTSDLGSPESVHDEILPPTSNHFHPRNTLPS